MSLFVTGTDTDVGKTVVSALLLARYGAERPLGYWKPVATGGTCPDRDVERVRAWCGDLVEVVPERALFEPPVSPHLAARLAGRPVPLEGIAEELRGLRARRPARGWVVEGIGGALVPLDEEGTMVADLVRRLGLPCLVVARSTLGTINHTLLTLEALASRRVPVAGVVLNGPPDEDNREAIERFGSVEVVAEVPPLGEISAGRLREAASRVDPEGRLRERLR